MKYTKPPQTYDQQAHLLISRGMAGDHALIVSRLQAVSYYRLSGYWFPFRDIDPANPKVRLDTFRPGTSLDHIWMRYIFDRRLRLLVMDALERIEIHVRSQLAYLHAHQYDAFAYASNPATLPGLKWPEWVEFLNKLKVETSRSKETFVDHFRKKYGDAHTCLPVWMACEIMTFGSVLTFHRGCDPKIRSLIAAPFGVHDTVFDSWLLALNTVRNICAHHGRLWNREFGTRPKIPAKATAWHAPVAVGNDRIFGTLTILKYSLDRIAPQSLWPDRMRALLAEFPHVPLVSMGFPANWETCPIWTPPAPPPPPPLPVAPAVSP